MTGIICAMQIAADGIIALSQNTQTAEIAGKMCIRDRYPMPQDLLLMSAQKGQQQQQSSQRKIHCS